MTKKLLFIFLLFGTLSAHALTPEQWREDLKYLADRLPHNHKNAFHRVTREQFLAAVQSLDGKIPSLADHEVIVGMMRLFTMVGDGHTMIDPPASFHTLPVSLFMFNGELRVTGAAKEYADIVGTKLVRIGDVPIKEAWARVMELVPHGENEQFLRRFGAIDLQYAEIVQALGLSKSTHSAAMTFEDDDGKQTTVEVRTDAKGEKVSAAKIISLSRKKQGDLSFTFLPEAKTLYFRFDVYSPAPEFSKFADELFHEMDTRRPAKLVVDLRQNSGGDMLRFRRLMLHEIASRAGTGHPVRLYVLIGRKTFSAAMINAIDLRKIGGVLVGEPTGARPNGYSENGKMTLPNSKLPAHFSKQYQQWADDKDEAVNPDHSIPVTWPDYVAGRDAALEWVLSH